MRGRYGSMGFMLKSASFAARDSAQSSCTFGLSPEFSTPVEKTVENPHETTILRLSLAKNRAKHVIFAPAKIKRNRAILNRMNLWEEILARVETMVNRHSFYTWFKPTAFVAADSLSVTVRVPNPLFKDWLMKHYAGVIGEAMSELRQPQLVVNFVAEPQNELAPV